MRHDNIMRCLCREVYMAEVLGGCFLFLVLGLVLLLFTARILSFVLHILDISVDDLKVVKKLKVFLVDE